MFLYEKKIVYLSIYADGSKEASAGFVRISRERDAYLLDIHIRQTALLADERYPLFLAFRDKKVQWTDLAAGNGEINAVRSVPINREMFYLEGEAFREEDFCGIAVSIDGRHEISGYWQEPAPVSAPVQTPVRKGETRQPAWKEVKAAGREEARAVGHEEVRTGGREKVKPTGYEKAKTGGREEVKPTGYEKAGTGGREEVKPIGYEEARTGGYGESRIEPPREILIEAASGDKWEQLQKCYKKVHPFGDERLFLSIEPKDFIILQAPFQRLVNNSFLLHGFYNYRHLILGPDKEMGNRSGSCFYLGVPGTYFEREKMVAVMFGFEGFECSGAVEIGKFGYYMRRVEI